MFSVPQGKPGVVGNYYSQEREVFYSGREFAQFYAPPLTVDGTASSNPLNAPYVWLLWAGMPLGKITATQKFANSILGLTTVAYTSGGTSLTTDVNTAAEIVRRLGTSGTLTLTGGTTAGATPVVYTVTYSTVNLTTGVVTVTNIGANVISGALIGPVDGSQNITTLLCENYGLQVVDQTHTTRVDVFCGRLLAGGGTINTGVIVNYPSDTGLQTYVKAGISSGTSGVTFLDNIL